MFTWNMHVCSFSSKLLPDGDVEKIAQLNMNQDLDNKAETFSFTLLLDLTKNTLCI